MTSKIKPDSTRRSALRGMIGGGILSVTLPLLDRLVGIRSGLLSSAAAQGYAGVTPGQGELVHISASSLTALTMAEWDDPDGITGANKIAASKNAVAKAPANASRYEVKSYGFPSGTLRVLTFKKGTPVHHQIAFETEIFVLAGSATLNPIAGHSGKPVKVSAGDGLFFPSGIFKSPKAADDLVLLLAYVSSANKGAKKSIVAARDAKQISSAKQYAFDGNSFRVTTLKKGGHTDAAPTGKYDALVYVAKGRLRRTTGNQSFEVAAGDAVRERANTSGSWEALEDSQVIATDAPVLPANFGPAMVYAGAGGKQIQSILVDDNGRSYSGFVNIPLKKVSETESLSEKQEGVHWRLGPRPQITSHARTSKEFASDGGPYEMHVGAGNHFVALMGGHFESTHQDGSIWRLVPGDFNYICPGALHHSNYFSTVPAVMMNLMLPDTPATKPTVFK